MILQVIASLLLLGAAAGSADQPGLWMCRKDPWILGEQPEQWSDVAGRVDVIKLYIGQINKADEDDLRRFARVVNARGIRIAVECAGLCDWRARFGDRAAELSFQDEFRNVKRYLDAGGHVHFLDMDGPFRRTRYQRVDGKPTRTEHHTLESTAQELVEVMELWREAVPGIEFYLLTNFPNWGFRDYPGYHAWDYTGEGEKGWGDYADVLEIAVETTNEAEIPLRGITCDNPYDYATGQSRSNQPDVTGGVDWTQRVLDLEKAVHDKDLEFGLIFNSQRPGARRGGSDKAYSRETLEYIKLYHSRGGSPDNVIIQSWYHYPSAWVPETEPYTMTHLVLQVARALGIADEDE